MAGDGLTALLAALEAELHHPGRACTPARLEQLLHPDFHEVGRSGKRYDRATVLAFLAGGPPRDGIRAGGYRARALAPDWALLHYHSFEVDADGRRRRGALRSSLWHRGADGQWRLFYHQGTPVDADALPAD
ncbi:MAG: DUF4440 domain-containing protein [Lysobacteraceae bacterium]|mgnify:FL=1|jgi:Uncharacterized protein conserved in bacteria|nr:DUF4440 domain-containing protein [Xanthomonadaceae bacterium]